MGNKPIIMGKAKPDAAWQAKAYLEHYKTVAQRIAEYRKQYPDDTITTRIYSQDDKRVVCVARVYRRKSAKNRFLISDGYAQEYIGSNEVNKESWLENCMTSAIGRALAAAGFVGETFASEDEIKQAKERRAGKNERDLVEKLKGEE